MPAFGPPTWAVLVFFRFRYPEIPAPALIVGGAIAATPGRLVLALAFRAFGTKLPAKRRESLEVLGHVLGEQRGGLDRELRAVRRRSAPVCPDVRGGWARPDPAAALRPAPPPIREIVLGQRP
jgi:hypothetical protein